MVNIEQDITAKCSSTLREFFETPQGKLLKLIGRSSVEWMGGAWNERLSEICMRAAEETHTAFDADEARVLTEMYERIRTKQHAPRTKEEIEAAKIFYPIHEPSSPFHPHPTSSRSHLGPSWQAGWKACTVAACAQSFYRAG